MIKHLYIHVPFCESICYYCDFCRVSYNRSLVSKWLETLAKEINEKCHDNYETIYIGGGTPTSLSDDELEVLLKLISPYSNSVKEYTIEVNPNSLDLNKIFIFKKYGINRISMGVQSSNDKLLRLMNRKHTFEDVKNKISLLKDNGLNNVSVDLIYSLPNQTTDILKETLEDFMELKIPHVSLYSLTIEENSVFGKKGYKALNEDIEADMYEMIQSYLKDNGFINYEISNFALNGYESLHNIGYWKYEDYLGISLGASSKIGNRRYTNTTNINSYLIDYNLKSEDNILSKDDLIFENLMMSLRMAKGLDLNAFIERYGVRFEDYYHDEYELSKTKGNVIINDNHLICLNRNILNSCLIDFMKG